MELFCSPLLCHSGIVMYTSSLVQESGEKPLSDYCSIGFTLALEVCQHNEARKARELWIVMWNKWQGVFPHGCDVSFANKTGECSISATEDSMIGLQLIIPLNDLGYQINSISNIDDFIKCGLIVGPFLWPKKLDNMTSFFIKYGFIWPNKNDWGRT